MAHPQTSTRMNNLGSQLESTDLIAEHGLRFRVAPGSKHKTGFFLDQRDNRKTLAGFCGGKRVLDLCCNSGGFSVYAKALGGATEVVGVVNARTLR